MTIEQLPFPKYTKGKKPEPAIDFLLWDDLYIEQWIIPKGATVFLYTTPNFGWVRFNKEQKDKRGFIPAKRLFKF